MKRIVLLFVVALFSGCAAKVTIKSPTSSARISRTPQSAQAASAPFAVTFTNAFWDYQVESSTNMVTWKTEMKGTNGASTVTFLDYFASVPRKFYRMVSGGTRPGKPVTLAWDANSEADLAGYKVQARTTNSPPLVIDVGNKTTNTVSGLIEGKTYSFTVTAYNLSGLESDPSNEIQWLCQKLE